MTTREKQSNNKENQNGHKKLKYIQRVSKGLWGSKKTEAQRQKTTPRDRKQQQREAKKKKKEIQNKKHIATKEE